MLTTALQQSVKIPVSSYLGLTEYAYTCYADSNDKNVFYVVPEIPVFSARDGKPQFMFYKYRSTDQQGGYAQFTVNLPQPTEEMKDKIRALLYNNISGQLSAKSTLIVKYVKANKAFKDDPTNKTKEKDRDTALKNTGLTAEQASVYEELYDPSKGDDQFLNRLMPDEAKKIKLQQPRYTTAQATLILDNNKAFYREIPTVLTPSGLGDNDTVFSLSLTGEGATLFEQVLKGSEKNASVGVRFNFTLDASLPAASVTVSYSSEKTKEVTQTIDRHTWSADEKKIEQKYLDAQAITSKVEIDLGAEELGMSQEQYLAWKESLRLWGQKQVEQILSSQTGLDMSLNLLNDAGGFDKFKESLNDTQSFTRVYSENAVVSFTIAPQTQLPSILSLLKKGEKLDDYFKEYDLDDPFYSHLQPEFYVTRDLAKYNIENVIVTVKYGDKASTLTFDKDNDKPKKTDYWYVDQKLGRVYSYSYVVNFSGVHAKPYHSGPIEVVDSLVETINVAQCGIVYADIATLISPAGWKIFEQVVVKTQYSDLKHGIEENPINQIVTEKNPPQPYIYPIGIKQEEPIFFTADYHTVDGSKLTYVPPGSDSSSQMPDYATTKANQIQIENALPRQQNFNVVFQIPEQNVAFISFDLYIDYPRYHFKITKNLTVDEFPENKKTIVKSLTVQVMADEAGNEAAYSYKATIVYNEKPEKTIEDKFTGTTVFVKC